MKNLSMHTYTHPRAGRALSALMPVLMLVLLVSVAGCPKSEAPQITTQPAPQSVAPGQSATFSVVAKGTAPLSYQWSKDGAEIAGATGSTFTIASVQALDEGSYACTISNEVGSVTSIDATLSLWNEDSFTYDVEFDPETVVVDEGHAGLLTNADAENHVYTFDAAGVQAAGLDFTVGSPLFIYGVAARRISAVRTEGPNLIVETEYATLPEVIKNGTIAWDYGVEFTPDKIQSVEAPGKGLIYPKDGTPIEFSMKIGDYTYEIKATLDGMVTNVEFTVSKDLVGSAGAKLVAKGTVQRFRSKNTIEIEDSKLTHFGHEVNGMRGDMTLDLVVAASGQDFINLEFPVTIMRIPFLVGGIPVLVDIKIQFVINASVPADGSARVSTTFGYDSDLGFSCDGVKVTAGGTLGSLEFSNDGTHQTGASSAISANFGVGFPRVSLNILGESVVLWAQTAFLVGGSYTFYPACQTADAEFLGAAGYNLGFFGLDLLSGKKTFFDQKKKLLRSGQCGDAKSEEILDLEAMLTE